jgi:hypothetical protein
MIGGDWLKSFFKWILSLEFHPEIALAIFWWLVVCAILAIFTSFGNY